MASESKIKHFIEVTNIKPSQELVNEVSSGVQSVLKWLKKLEEVNIDNVEPMFYVFGEESLTTREDNVAGHACLEDILLNAPEKEDDVITLPKVVK